MLHFAEIGLNVLSDTYQANLQKTPPQADSSTRFYCKQSQLKSAWFSGLQLFVCNDFYFMIYFLDFYFCCLDFSNRRCCIHSTETVSPLIFALQQLISSNCCLSVFLQKHLQKQCPNIAQLVTWISIFHCI